MTKETEIKVDAINLTVGKKEISLSVEEARKLLTVLQELFNTAPKTTFVPYPVKEYIPWYPRPWWDSSGSSPQIIWLANNKTTLCVNADKAYSALLEYQK